MKEELSLESRFLQSISFSQSYLADEIDYNISTKRDELANLLEELNTQSGELHNRMMELFKPWNDAINEKFDLLHMLSRSDTPEDSTGIRQLIDKARARENAFEIQIDDLRTAIKQIHDFLASCRQGVTPVTPSTPDDIPFTSFEDTFRTLLDENAEGIHQEVQEAGGVEAVNSVHFTGSEFVSLFEAGCGELGEEYEEFGSWLIEAAHNDQLDSFKNQLLNAIA